jgi:hypothetical protein
LPPRATAEASLNVMMPNGIFAGQDVARRCLLEGHRLRRVLSALRYSLRNGLSSKDTTLGELKQLCQKSPQKRRQQETVDFVSLTRQMLNLPVPQDTCEVAPLPAGPPKFQQAPHASTCRLPWL